MSSTRCLVLVRHGQSEANAANVFTGWSDPPLTRQGEDEARSVARRLKAARIVPTAIFVSALQRAAATAAIIAGAMDISATPVTADAALNERDYGELTGLNKAEASARWGAARMHHWRRSYAEPPPGGESLRDTLARVLPFYIRRILPVVMQGQTALVVSHGNTLRALVMALDGLAPAAVEDLELPTGITLVYHMAADTSVVTRFELDDSPTAPTSEVFRP